MKILLFSILFQGTLTISFSQNYYRTIPFSHSPLYAFKGGAIINKGIDSTAVYYFHFEDEKLKSVTYQINGKFKPLYENYTCSDFIWAAVNLFKYNDDDIIIQHFNYLEKPIEDNPAISVYSKDEQGRIVELKYFDKENNPTEFKGVHKYKWQYLESGIGEIRYSIDGNIVPMSNWFPYKWVVLHFDEKKNLSSMIETSDNWKPQKGAAKIEFEVNNNEITRWIATDINTQKRTSLTGPKVAETRHTFNEYGYLIMTRFYDTEGNRTKSIWGHKGFKRVYNVQGNRKKYNFINGDDEIEFSEERGYSGQMFIWGVEGRLRLKTFYIDEKETPIFRNSKGYAQIDYLYNYLGETIGEVYKNERGEVLSTKQAPSYILLENNHGGNEYFFLRK